MEGVDLGRKLAVVADENTWSTCWARACMRRCRVRLSSCWITPRPRRRRPISCRSAVAGADALIAVGSGTINDLCKYVTHRTGRHCAVFATAPSMDGYVTTTVSITRDGFKASLPAHAPRGVFFDLGVLRQRPCA